jgi:chemotaxis signal transduction protein
MTERGILFFSLGGRRHAVEADAVRRIATGSEDEPTWIRSSILGSPSRPRRGLVAALEGEERALAVDEVEGIELVPADRVSPLPPLARETIRTRGIAGIVRREDELLFLVDLPQLIRESSKELSSHAEDE